MEPLQNLILKSPIYEDAAVPFAWDWTVLDLKKYIMENYSSKPKVHQQKLIYSGRLLKDEQLLKDIFRKEDQIYVHIICTASFTKLEDNNLTKKISQKETKASDEFKRQETPPSNENQQAFNLYSYSNNNFQSNVYSNEYMQIYQQSYIDSWNLYYQNIAQYYQTMYSHSYMHPNPYASPFMPTHPMLNITQFNGGPGNDMNQNNNLVNNPNVNNVAANNMMAAPGGIGLGAAEEANGNERVDWVDWIYVFFRVGILFSILYFYSSVNRFLVVLLFSTLIFLYQAGFLVYPLRRNNNPVVQPAAAPNDIENREGTLPDQDTPTTSSSPSPPTTQEINGLTQQLKNKLNIVWNGTQVVLIVFATFFTSLIPERPPPVNLN